MSSSRHISRPRPSLSCEACRRRKVRCGREQPKCQSCQKTNETCVYSSNLYKEDVRHPRISDVESSPLFNTTAINENDQNNSGLSAALMIAENLKGTILNDQFHQPLNTDVPSWPQDPVYENSLPFSRVDAAETEFVFAGYFGNDSASRPRYIENSFWALLHDQVKYFQI
jgi:hypothetical protein